MIEIYIMVQSNLYGNKKGTSSDRDTSPTVAQYIVYIHTMYVVHTYMCVHTSCMYVL